MTGYPGIDFAVARFDPAGRLDLGFGSEGLATTDLGGPALYDIPVSAPDGKIVVAGLSYPPGAASDFAVARYLGGPPPCKVPNLRGRKLAAAKARIKRAGCRVGKVHSQALEEGAEGPRALPEPSCGRDGSERRQGEARRGQGPQALNSSA